MGTLSVTPLYFDLSGEYEAADVRFPWRDVTIEGVNENDGLLVVAKGGTASNPDAGGGARNMSVDVLTGSGWVTGDDSPPTQGAYRCYQAGTDNNAITSNGSGNPRIDLVILEVLDTPTNQARIRVVAGTPAGSPTAPALPSNALALAQVAVASGATSITGSNITDLRTYATGYFVTTGVTSDVNLAGSAWTGIGTATVVVGRDQRAVVGANWKIANSGTAQPLVAAALLDGSTLIRRTGSISLSGSGATSGQQWCASMEQPVKLTAGTHNIILQGYSDTGGSTVKANGSGTLQGYTDTVCNVWVRLIP